MHFPNTHSSLNFNPALAHGASPADLRSELGPRNSSIPQTRMKQGYTPVDPFKPSLDRGVKKLLGRAQQDRTIDDVPLPGPSLSVHPRPVRLGGPLFGEPTGDRGLFGEPVNAAPKRTFVPAGTGWPGPVGGSLFGAPARTDPVYSSGRHAQDRRGLGEDWEVTGDGHRNQTTDWYTKPARTEISNALDESHHLASHQNSWYIPPPLRPQQPPSLERLAPKYLRPSRRRPQADAAQQTSLDAQDGMTSFWNDSNDSIPDDEGVQMRKQSIAKQGHKPHHPHPGIQFQSEPAGEGEALAKDIGAYQIISQMFLAEC